MLAAGQPIDAQQEKTGFTALHGAAANDQLAAVRLLLHAGAGATLRSLPSHPQAHLASITPLQLAQWQCRSTAVINLLAASSGEKPEETGAEIEVIRAKLTAGQACAPSVAAADRGGAAPILHPAADPPTFRCSWPTCTLSMDSDGAPARFRSLHRALSTAAFVVAVLVVLLELFGRESPLLAWLTAINPFSDYGGLHYLSRWGPPVLASSNVLLVLAIFVMGEVRSLDLARRAAKRRELG